MSKREFASVILKLLGVYALIQSLQLLNYSGAFFWMFFVDREEFLEKIWMYVGMTIPFLLMLIAAVILILCSGSIAKRLIKDDNELPLPGEFSSKDFQAILFAAVGVLVFLLAIPRLSQFILTLWYLQKQYASQADLNIYPRQNQFIINTWQQGIASVIQCGLAIILFFKTRGLANFWHRIQTARYEKI